MPKSKVVTLELDPNDPFDAVLIDMYNMNRSKRKDYAGDDHPYQNFIDSAYLTNGTVGTSVEVLLGTKASRLRTLLKPDGSAPNHESIRDTLLDRAVYSTISVGIYDLGGYDYVSNDIAVVANINSL